MLELVLITIRKRKKSSGNLILLVSPYIYVRMYIDRSFFKKSKEMFSIIIVHRFHEVFSSLFQHSEKEARFPDKEYVPLLALLTLRLGTTHSDDCDYRVIGKIRFAE